MTIKNNFLIIGILFTIICSLLFIYAADIKYSICGDSKMVCWERYNLFAILSLFGPTILVTSLFSRLVTEEKLITWKKFTSYFSIIYIFIVIITPWDMGNAMAGPSLSKGLVAIGLCILYILLSFIYFGVTKFTKK